MKESKRIKVLELEPNQTEHDLFRAAIQMVVSVRQDHPREVMLSAAKRLEEMALKHADFRHQWQKCGNE